MTAATLREQQPALDALAELARVHPDLPGATLHADQHDPGAVTAQLSAQGAFEAWREALMVPPESVDLVAYGNTGAGRIEFRTTVAGAPIHVWLAMAGLPTEVAS